jgi:hypothetical protein
MEQTERDRIIAGIELKKCRRCGETKEVDCFRPFFLKSVEKWYRRSYCKPCLNQIREQLRDSNPANKSKKNERDRKYYHRIKNSKE